MTRWIPLFLLSTSLCQGFVPRIVSRNGFSSATTATTVGTKNKSWRQTLQPYQQQQQQPARCRCRVSASSKYGEDMDQQAMMESDMLVIVDQNDILVQTPESTSKKLAHTFNEKQPRGILHRAFSFFLFDQDNKMLLTQRASSKITFPGVWTNTCCSHPLHGMTPNEVDPVPAAYPEFPGIKHAAIRKLRHELGIEPEYIQHDRISFISRFHYWASDTNTYGKEAPWGEHGEYYKTQRDL